MEKLPLELILPAMNAAIEKAQQEGISIAISITYASGRPAGSLAMPDAFLASGEYAYWKAWTAASFKLASASFRSMLSELDDLTREGLLAHDKVTALPGGLPIFKDSILIGAVGVSGGSGEQDDACAEAARACFENS